MAGTTKITKSSRGENMAKLHELRLKMNESRKLNRQEVVEEDKRSKLPSNWEAKQARLEKQEEEEKLRKECSSKGENYDMMKTREWTAEEVEQWDQRRKRKKNPDEGFADYEQATFRQYQKLTRQLRPNLEEYNKEKEKLGEEVFYASVNTIGTLDHKDSREAIDRMAADLEKQVAKKAKYSRRRAHDEDADIDFINERNMKFNKKLERFYGQYTTEIKQNLERGTAI